MYKLLSKPCSCLLFTEPGSVYRSGSRVLMTKTWRKYSWNFIIFLIKKNAIYLSIGLQKGRPSYKPSALKREHPVLQKIKFISCFIFFGVIFALPDPDPQHCCYHLGMGTCLPVCVVLPIWRQQVFPRFKFEAVRKKDWAGHQGTQWPGKSYGRLVQRTKDARTT